MNENLPQTSIFIKNKDYYQRIYFHDILYIEAAGSYSTLFLKNDTKLMVAFNLCEISDCLCEKSFVRIHRSYIINVDHIDAFVGNMLCVGKHRIPLSHSCRLDLLNKFNILKNNKI